MSSSAGAFLLAACLLGDGALAQERPSRPLERRAHKVERHLEPDERRVFQALLRKANGDPGALEVVIALHEHVLNLRDLREHPFVLPPDEHRARR
ncbi:MAG: hypothetical protein HY553_20095, partial [Elusimicrobia bacterium]|nr:hypothetical protein [Elusimicrobiota bacterium]